MPLWGWDAPLRYAPLALDVMAKNIDRDKLVKKREELKARLHTEARLSLIDDLIQYLDSKNVRYKIKYDNTAIDWIIQSFPFSFASIDWARTKNAKRISYSTYEERDRLVQNAIDEFLKKDDPVIVAWSNAERPEIETTAETIINNTNVFAEEDFDFWVLNIDKGFCLENYHEGYVGWAVRP